MIAKIHKRKKRKENIKMQNSRLVSVMGLKNDAATVWTASKFLKKFNMDYYQKT